MKEKNRCVTFFTISGSYFEPREITKILGIQPDKSWRSDDLRADGKPYDFSYWECGRCDEYDVYTEEQMEKTISILLDKIDLLKKIYDNYDVGFTLEVIPEVNADEITPCLAPSMKVIDFCHETRTRIDIDLYVYSEDEE